MQVNHNRWIELKRTIDYAELAARLSLADEFSVQRAAFRSKREAQRNMKLDTRLIVPVLLFQCAPDAIDAE